MYENEQQEFSFGVLEGKGRDKNGEDPTPQQIEFFSFT